MKKVLLSAAILSNIVGSFAANPQSENMKIDPFLPFSTATPQELKEIYTISTSPRKDVPVRLAKEFRSREVSELQNNGSWKKIQLDESNPEYTVFKGTFKPVQMRIFRIK